MAVLPKTKQRKWNRKPKRKDSPHKSFYQSKWWKSASKDFLRRNPICVWYGQRPRCTKEAKITDHIKPMTDGGDKTDQSNWQPMCKSCSQAKTNMEVANRRLKVKKTITPRGLV